MNEKTNNNSWDELEVISIPLGRNGAKGQCSIYRADYEYLMDLGLSGSWNLMPKGYVICPAYKARGGNVGVARVLMNAGAGQNIRYLDGDPLNLRRDNLQIVYEGWSRRRDRDFLTPLRIKNAREVANV